MRAAVVILNVLSVLGLLVVEPFAFYVGAWGLVGPAYGDYGSVAIGLAVMTAPLVLVGLCVWQSVRRMRGGQSGALLIAALPVVAFCVLAGAIGWMFDRYN